jgi:saccharopine dehydrogenase-like NADP-dependent oxidoreductase
MKTKKHTIFIAGAGGIGWAVALLLREWAEFDLDLYIGDINEHAAFAACERLTENSSKRGNVSLITMPLNGSNPLMDEAFSKSDIILDCLPGEQAPRLASFAKKFNLHYANLTEYVAETDYIIEIAQDAKTGFVLQTGLAPGFVNVLAMSLYNKFTTQFGVKKVEKIGMKVGALTAHAHSPHFYGFTWSPIGVATEYVKNSRVIRDYKVTELPALSDRETIVIGGRAFEADLTSGGAADLPEYFTDISKSLDYKTLRHIGHFGWAQKIIHEFPNDNDLPNKVLAKFLQDIPSVEDDFVLVHASVDGFDDHGVRRMIEKAFFIEPLEINGHKLRAIQTTTAAPLAQSAIMLLTGNFRGLVLQSQINPSEFLEGLFVKRIYGT